MAVNPLNDIILRGSGALVGIISCFIGWSVCSQHSGRGDGGGAASHRHGQDVDTDSERRGRGDASWSWSGKILLRRGRRGPLGARVVSRVSY